MGFDKYVIVHIYYYSIMQNTSTALKNPFPALPPQTWPPIIFLLWVFSIHDSRLKDQPLLRKAVLERREREGEEYRSF